MYPATPAETCKTERLTVTVVLGTQPSSPCSQKPVTGTHLRMYRLKVCQPSLYAAVSGSVLSLEVGYPAFGKSHQKERSSGGLARISRLKEMGIFPAIAIVTAHLSF